MRIVVAACFMLAAKIALASFITGTVDERKSNKYALRNFNRSSISKYSLTTFRPSLYDFKGSQALRTQSGFMSNSFEVNSLVRLESGNTTYVFPYRYKVKVSRFVTPSRH